MKTDEKEHWLPLNAYQDVTAIEFESQTAVYKAIDCFWADQELASLPREFVGAQTFIVPTKGLVLLKNKGLRFRQRAVTSMAELSREERLELGKTHS